MGQNESSEIEAYLRDPLKEHSVKSLEDIIANAISQLTGDTYKCEINNISYEFFRKASFNVKISPKKEKS